MRSGNHPPVTGVEYDEALRGKGDTGAKVLSHAVDLLTIARGDG